MMRGILSRAVKRALSARGVDARAIRPFHSYAVAVLKPGDPGNHLTHLQETGFIDGNREVLKIATMPEFSMNRFERRELVPITAAEYERTRDMLVKQAQRLPEGTLFCLGTVAVDTGATSETGKKIGVNRGGLIATGTGEFIEWDKQSVSTIDSWPRDYTVQTSAKEAAVVVKRLSDVGRDVVISLRTCLDIKAPPAFDIHPDLIISPAFGSPLQAEYVRAPYRGSVVILCDNGNGDLQDLFENRQEIVIDSERGIDLHIKSGLWEVVSRDFGKYRFLTNNFGNIFTTWLHSVIPSLKKYQEIADVYSKVTSFGTFYPEYGIAVTREVPFQDLTPEQVEARRLLPDFTIFYDRERPNKYAENLKTLAKTIQWDIVDSECHTFIKKYVSNRLASEDVLSNRSSDWTARINSNEFQTEVLDYINLKALELLVSTGDARIGELAEAYGNKLGQLVQDTIGHEIFSRVTEGTAEASYLGELVHSHVLAMQTHALSERISETQREMAESADRIKETSKELRKRHEDAERIREALERSQDDRELLEKQKQLEKEIAELKRKAEALEKKSEDIRKEARERNRELEERRKERQEAEKRMREKRAKIYKI